MNTLTSDTKITFPQFSCRNDALVLFASSADQANENQTQLWNVITDLTPFHPVDHVWADQPGDQGTLAIADKSFPIIDSITGAVQAGSEKLYFDKEIPIKGLQPGWNFLVVHRVVFPIDFDPLSLVDKTVTLNVNETRRNKLSASHTAAHLMSLALNKATKSFWSKQTRLDCFNNPNLDQAAIQSSTITETESVDVYRLGKSLRKSGFDSTRFVEEIANIINSIETEVNNWVAAPSQSGAQIISDPSILSGRRRWELSLPDGMATINCGGTHIKNLSELKGISFFYEISGDKSQLTIHSIPVGAP